MKHQADYRFLLTPSVLCDILHNGRWVSFGEPLYGSRKLCQDYFLDLFQKVTTKEQVFGPHPFFKNMC